MLKQFRARRLTSCNRHEASCDEWPVGPLECQVHQA